MFVHAVVALDDEMLIELHSVWLRRGSPEATMWLHSPANVASIITLTRWRDARTAIEVRRTSYGVVLCNEQARVSLMHARLEHTL